MFSLLLSNFPWGFFFFFFCFFFRERFRGISLNSHPGKIPVNLSLPCKNQQDSSWSLLSHGLFYFLWDILPTEPYWFWVWFWASATISEFLTGLAIQNKVNQEDNLTLFCSPSVSAEASSMMSMPRYLLLEHCMLLGGNKNFRHSWISEYLKGTYTHQVSWISRTELWSPNLFNNSRLKVQAVVYRSVQKKHLSHTIFAEDRNILMQVCFNKQKVQ